MATVADFYNALWSRCDTADAEHLLDWLMAHREESVALAAEALTPERVYSFGDEMARAYKERIGLFSGPIRFNLARHGHELLCTIAQLGIAFGLEIDVTRVDVPLIT